MKVFDVEVTIIVKNAEKNMNFSISFKLVSFRVENIFFCHTLSRKSLVSFSGIFLDFRRSPPSQIRGRPHTMCKQYTLWVLIVILIISLYFRYYLVAIEIQAICLLIELLHNRALNVLPRYRTIRSLRQIFKLLAISSRHRKTVGNYRK